MKTSTRFKFTALCAAMAATYGVSNVSEMFAATPTTEQKLADKIVESSAFLQKINVLPVDDLTGEKIFGSVTGFLGKRTDTTVGDRQTQGVMSLDPFGYTCKKTEFDAHITYAMLDAWSKFPDFNERFTKYVRKAIAISRIKTGFYGTAAAAVTDPATNINGEDVNVGWFQHLRNYNSGAQMLDVGATPGEIRVGDAAGTDYKNLDALVFDTLQMVGDVHRDGGDLVAIMGRDLLAYDKTQLYAAQGATPTEKERIEAAAVTRTYGGLPAVTIPFFPARGLLITSWDNLSLYFQAGAVRQKVEDNSKRDRIEHYNTMNEAYVIEDLEKASGIEYANVKLWDGTAFS